MIDTKDITKMVSHIMRRDRGLSDPQIMHPMREWLTGIVVALIIVVAGSIFAAVLYRSYVTLSLTTVTAPETPIPYKAALMEEVLKIYRTKSLHYNSLRGNVPTETMASSTEAIHTEATEATSTSSDVEFPDAITPADETEEVAPLEGGEVVPPSLAI